MFADTKLGFQVSRAARSFRQTLQDAFRREGIRITPEEWSLLSQLRSHDGCSQRELAGMTSRDRTTVTRLLDGMVEKGLVRRLPDDQDRRIARAWLTRKGRTLQHRVARVVAESVRLGARGVARADLDITLRTLERIQQNLSEGISA